MHFQARIHCVHSCLKCIPNPVCGGRWDVDCQCPAALLNLHGEQQRRVGHLLHLLLDELRLRGLLEVLGLGYFVHKAHYLARPMATDKAAMWVNGRFVIYPEQLLSCALQISVQLMCDDKGNAAAAHPSLPAGTALSLRNSGGSSSSDEPALDDSSSLSARQYVRGLGLSHKHRRIRNPPSVMHNQAATAFCQIINTQGAVLFNAFMLICNVSKKQCRTFYCFIGRHLHPNSPGIEQIQSGKHPGKSSLREGKKSQEKQL